MKVIEITITVLGFVMISGIWPIVDSIALTTIVAQSTGVLEPTTGQKRLQELDSQSAEEIDYKTKAIQAQTKLKELGYYKARIDGIVGSKTRRALMDFQRDMNLSITAQLDNETIEYLSRTTLILNTQDFAPFHYRIKTFKDKVYGPVPQAIRAICIEAKINCLLRLYDWGYAQELVKNDKAHGMFVIGWNADRAKWLYRSIPIIETEYGIFVRDDDSLDVKQISDLDGYTIGVYGPSNTSRTLRQIENTLKNRGMEIHVKQIKDDKPLFKELSTSKGKRAVYSNRDVGNTIINGLGLENIRYAGSHKKLLYYVGFSKNLVNKSIVSRFNEAFIKLEKQGLIKEIYANSGLKKEMRNVIRVTNEKKEPQKKIKMKYEVKILEGKEIIIDNTTCLMWQKSGSEEEIKWDEAINYVESINKEGYAGFSDWRLPKINELESLLTSEIQKENRLYIDPLFDAMQQTCWSSDGMNNDRQYVDFYEGNPASKDQLDTNFIRAVRGTNCNKTASDTTSRHVSLGDKQEVPSPVEAQPVPQSELGADTTGRQTQTARIDMVTGAQTETYVRFGQDIAKVARNAGLDVVVQESEGPLDTIRHLASAEDFAVGLIQSDVLAFMLRSPDPELNRIAAQLRLLFPLHNENVHLFARLEIQRFEDLDGKRVVIGTPGSSSWLTAKNLLRTLINQPAELLDNLPPLEAAAAVLMGRADAMFYVADEPVPFFTRIRKLQEDTRFTHLLPEVHFVPLNHETMLKDYVASTIRPDDYAWMNTTVPTIAVKAALISFDGSEHSIPHSRQRCAQLATLGRVVQDNFATLQRTGHRKWHEVDLQHEITLWKRDSCIQSVRDNLAQGEQLPSVAPISKKANSSTD